MRTRVTLDIHNYEKQYALAEREVKQSELSDRNRSLILSYRDACLVKGTCGRVRLVRVMGVLLLYGRMLKKDFDQATKEDVEGLIAALLNRKPPYSAETIGTYKAILKGFLTWVVAPDRFPTKEPPAIVAWITTHVRRSDKKRLERRDLLTPEDIQALLDVCRNPRDKALISILWETGGRIAEIGNLQLKHVTKTPHGYSLDVNGKTGQRSPMIISSAPHLTVWLNNHPFKTDPEAPLWVHYQFSSTAKPLRYDTIRFLLGRYFERAHISKPFNPHAFRHSRATYVLANGIMNESQAKAYFGWVPDSDMLATYSHLIDQDANNAILKENNLAPLQQKATDLLPVTCTVCGELNLPKTDYCVKCGAVLNLTKAYEHQQTHQLKDDILMSLVRLLVERGLVDDAAKQIHDAGLGETLRRLAERPTEIATAGPLAGASRPDPGETPPSTEASVR
ncbi:MAG: site-specific integrase [Acidobacteriota bacterium]|nr:site-specific integrase [Acidobacteriota bacterium]